MTQYTFDLDNKSFYAYVATQAFWKWIEENDLDDYMSCVHNDILQGYWEKFSNKNI